MFDELLKDTGHGSRIIVSKYRIVIDYAGDRLIEVEYNKISQMGILPGGGGGGTRLCDLNRDVRPDRVWFSGCFVLNGVSISSLSVLNRVSVHYPMA